MYIFYKHLSKSNIYYHQKNNNNWICFHDLKKKTHHITDYKSHYFQYHKFINAEYTIVEITWWWSTIKIYLILNNNIPFSQWGPIIFIMWLTLFLRIIQRLKMLTIKQLSTDKIITKSAFAENYSIQHVPATQQQAAWSNIHTIKQQPIHLATSGCIFTVPYISALCIN